MDPKPNESSPDRVEPVAEQQQISNILHLVSTLSSGGITASEVWRDKGYHVPDFGNQITDISVSRLTEQGQREEPTFPLAIVRIFRRNEDGRIQTDYRIFTDKEQLRIDRHESLTIPEEEEVNRTEDLRFKETVRTMTAAQRLKALQDMQRRLEERGEAREFERKIGESYVDNIEAQQVIDILAKLTDQQKSQPSK